MSYYGEPNTFTYGFIRNFTEALGTDGEPDAPATRLAWVVMEALKGINNQDDIIKAQLAALESGVVSVRADLRDVHSIHETGLSRAAYLLEEARLKRQVWWDQLAYLLSEDQLKVVMTEAQRFSPERELTPLQIARRASDAVYQAASQEGRTDMTAVWEEAHREALAALVATGMTEEAAEPIASRAADGAEDAT